MADWFVLTWKASLHNWFCWFLLCFWKITYAKNSVFQGYLLEIFCWTKNKRNLCFAKCCSHCSMAFAELVFNIIHILVIMLLNSLTIASLVQARCWIDRIWIYFVVITVRFCFPLHFSTTFKNKNTLLVFQSINLVVQT